MNDIELIGATAHFVQHRKMRRGVRLQWSGVEPDGLITDRGKTCLGPGIGTGKQSDIVAEFHERIAQVGDDPFRTAVELGRDGFIQWGNLCDSHGPGFSVASERPWMMMPPWAVYSAKSPWFQTPGKRAK
jgi:hypothetical protein